MVRMLMKCALVIIFASGFAGCSTQSAQDFPVVNLNEFTVGETTVEELYARLGEAPHVVEHANGNEAAHIYRSDRGAIAFRFKDGVLQSMNEYVTE